MVASGRYGHEVFGDKIRQRQRSSCGLHEQEPQIHADQLWAWRGASRALAMAERGWSGRRLAAVSWRILLLRVSCPCFLALAFLSLLSCPCFLALAFLPSFLPLVVAFSDSSSLRFTIAIMDCSLWPSRASAALNGKIGSDHCMGLTIGAPPSVQALF